MRINPGIEGSVDIILPSDANAATIPVQMNNYAGNVQIGTGNGVVYYNWLFDNSGSLTLPANGDFAHIQTGLDKSITIETPGNTLQRLQITPTDGVKVYTNNDTNEWLFDNTGNLILPGNGIISNPANSSLDPLFPNVSTMVLQPDSNYYQSLVIDPTSPGHIHLRSPSYSSNIDEPTANLFLGGELSSFEVPYSSSGAPNVYVHSNGQTWTFDTTGYLTLPTNGDFAHIQTGNNKSLTIETPGNTLQRIQITPADGIKFYANNDGYLWQFDNTGNLTIPKNLLGLNNGNPIVVDAGATGDSYISIPSFTDGGEQLVIKNAYYGSQGIRIETETGNFVFSSGSLTFPDSTVQSTAYTGASSYGDSNVATFLAAYGSNTVSTTGNISAGNFIGAGSNVDIVAGSYDWTFDSAGNLTLPGIMIVTTGITGSGASPAPYLSGFSTLSAQSITLSGTGTAVNASSGNILTNKVTGTQFAFLNGAYTATLTGGGATSNYTLALPANAGTNGQVLTTDGSGNLSWTTAAGSYDNSNVTTLLAAFGSNTVSTTGNVTSGNLITSGNVNALSAFVNAAAVITSGRIDVGTAMSAVGNVTGGNILTAGLISSTGNILTNAQIQSTAFAGGNISWNAVNRTDFQGSIKVGGAGQLLSPGGAASITLNNNGANIPTLVATSSFTVTGNANIVGTTNTGIGAITAGATNTLLSNTVAGMTANVNNYTQVTFQNLNTGTDATADFILTSDNGNDTVNYGDFGIINSGYDNSTPTNSLGNIVYAADTYLYAQGNLSTTKGGNLAIGTTTTGKILRLFAGGATMSSVIANVSATGVAVTGNSSATQDLVATGNVYANGGYLRTSAATAYVFNAVPTTVNMGGAATIAVNIGNAAGIVNLSGNVQGSTNGFAIGYRDIPQVSFTGNTTIALSDAGKHYYSTQSTNYTLTVANNATVAFSTGAAINIINQGTGTITIAPGVGVTMYLAGNSKIGRAHV